MKLREFESEKIVAIYFKLCPYAFVFPSFAYSAVCLESRIGTRDPKSVAQLSHMTSTD